MTTPEKPRRSRRKAEEREAPVDTFAHEDAAPAISHEALDALLREDPTLSGLYEVLEAEVAAYREASQYTAVTEQARVRRRLPRTEATVSANFSDEDQDWKSIGGTGLDVLSADDSTRQRILRQCTHLYYRDPYARNIIRSYTFLLKGSGLSIQFPETEKKLQTVQDRWYELTKSVRWSRFVTKTILLTLLQGEHFVLRTPYVDDAEGWDKATGRVNDEKVQKKLQGVKPAMVGFSVLSPLEVEEIIPSETNREVPRYYRVNTDLMKRLLAAGVVKPSTDSARGYLSACSVIHFAVEDFDGLRGRPVLEPVLKALAHVRLFKTDRLMMNAIRARIPLIRKVSGLRKSATRSAMQTSGLPRPGTVAIVDKDEEWEYPGGPGDGGSAEKDLRALRLDVCAGVSLPEYLVTSDASNGNYASTLVQSSPTIMLINHYRDCFRAPFEELVSPLLGVYATVQFPELVYTDFAILAQALLLLQREGAISMATLRAKIGVDSEDEDEKIKHELDAERPYDLAGAANADRPAPPLPVEDEPEDEDEPDGEV